MIKRLGSLSDLDSNQIHFIMCGDKGAKYLQYRGAIYEPISSMVSWHCVSLCLFIIAGTSDIRTLHSNWFCMHFSVRIFFLTNMQNEMRWIKQGCREFRLTWTYEGKKEDK